MEEVVIDALILRGLLTGQRPHIDDVDGRVGRYLVSLPEYLLLCDALDRIADSCPMPESLRTVTEASQGGVSKRDWLTLILDLAGLREIYGLNVEIVAPSTDRCREVVAIVAYYELSQREAVNVLTAEQFAAPFLVDRESNCTNIELAMKDRGVRVLHAA